MCLLQHVHSSNRSRRAPQPKESLKGQFRVLIGEVNTVKPIMRKICARKGCGKAIQNGTCVACKTDQVGVYEYLFEVTLVHFNNLSKAVTVLCAASGGTMLMGITAIELARLQPAAIQKKIDALMYKPYIVTLAVGVNDFGLSKYAWRFDPIPLDAPMMETSGALKELYSSAN